MYLGNLKSPDKAALHPYSYKDVKQPPNVDHVVYSVFLVFLLKCENYVFFILFSLKSMF